MYRPLIRRSSWSLAVVAALLAVLLTAALGAFAQSGATGNRAVQSHRVAAASFAAKAGDPIYLEYTGVTGAPSAIDHTSHVRILSFQLGQNRVIQSDAASGERRAAPPANSDACLTAATDKYSTGLFKEALSGTPKDAILYFTKASHSNYGEYMRMEFHDAMLSSWNWNWTQGDRILSETFCLNFRQLTVTYRAAGQDQSASWDYFIGAPLTTP